MAQTVRKHTQGRRRASPIDDLEAEVRELAGLRKQPAEIERLLIAKYATTRELPSKRTIQLWCERFRAQDAAAGEKPWTLPQDAGPDDVYVLESLYAVVVVSEGRIRTIGNETARWVVAVRHVAPTLSGWMAYRLARLYETATASDTSTESLDLWLTFAPWHGDEARERYLTALKTWGLPATPLDLTPDRGALEVAARVAALRMLAASPGPAQATASELLRTMETPDAPQDQALIDLTVAYALAALEREPTR